MKYSSRSSKKRKKKKKVVNQIDTAVVLVNDGLGTVGTVESVYKEEGIMEQENIEERNEKRRRTSKAEKKKVSKESEEESVLKRECPSDRKACT